MAFQSNAFQFSAFQIIVKYVSTITLYVQRELTKTVALTKTNSIILKIQNELRFDKERLKENLYSLKIVRRIFKK